MSRPLHELDIQLQLAVASGLLTLGQAQDVDAFADGLVARVEAGEFSEEDALDLAGKRGAAEAQAVLRARGEG